MYFQTLSRRAPNFRGYQYTKRLEKCTRLLRIARLNSLKLQVMEEAKTNCAMLPEVWPMFYRRISMQAIVKPYLLNDCERLCEAFLLPKWQLLPSDFVFVNLVNLV
jgi:hypothetical protein